MTSPSDQHDTSPSRQLNINLSDLVDAMDSGFDESQAYLDLQSGAIHVLSTELLSSVEEDELDEVPDWERRDIEIARRIIDNDEHLAEIPPFDSAESFRIMADFVAQLEDEHARARARMADALSRPKPFRRFKDALSEFPAVRERWFAFERQCKERLATEWLSDLGIKATTS